MQSRVTIEFQGTSVCRFFTVSTFFSILKDTYIFAKLSLFSQIHISINPSTMDEFEREFNSDADNGETEDGSYARADLEDVMEQGELGEQLEAVERATGQRNRDEEEFDRQLSDLRKACVSEKSQTSYIGSMVLMLNWFVRKSFDDSYAGYQPVTQRWLNDLSMFGVDDDTGRKKLMKEWLEVADIENPPIDFDEFKPGKFILYYTFKYITLI